MKELFEPSKLEDLITEDILKDFCERMKEKTPEEIAADISHIKETSDAILSQRIHDMVEWFRPQIIEQIGLEPESICECGNPLKYEELIQESETDIIFWSTDGKVSCPKCNRYLGSFSVHRYHAIFFHKSDMIRHIEANLDANIKSDNEDGTLEDLYQLEYFNNFTNEEFDELMREVIEYEYTEGPMQIKDPDLDPFMVYCTVLWYLDIMGVPVYRKRGV